MFPDTEPRVIILTDGTVWCARCGWEQEAPERRVLSFALAKVHRETPGACQDHYDAELAASIARHPAGGSDG